MGHRTARTSANDSLDLEDERVRRVDEERDPFGEVTWKSFDFEGTDTSLTQADLALLK
jgi:hypothetical protein